MKFTTKIVPGKSVEQIRTEIAQPLVSFLMENGEQAADAMKMATALGPKASLCLTTPEIHVCDVTREAMEQNNLLDVFQGALQLPLRNATGEKEVALRPSTEEDPQRIYAIALQKAGMTSKENGATHFYSYRLVVLQTTSEQVLVVNMNITFDGEFYSGEINRGFYNESNVPTITGTRNRLETLTIPDNVAQIAVAAMQKAGFPLPLDKNRASRQERFERNQTQRQGGKVQARQLAGVSVSSTHVQNGVEEDYFRGE